MSLFIEAFYLLPPRKFEHLNKPHTALTKKRIRQIIKTISAHDN